MYSYSSFRSQLKDAYPISHGELRIPISTQLHSFDELNLQEHFSCLEKELQEMLDDFSDDQTVHALQDNHEAKLLPLLSQEYSGIIRVDCVIDSQNQFKVLEINADYPDGLILHDYTYGVLSGKQNFRHRDLFLSLFDDKDSIYVMYQAGSFFKDAYYQEYLALKNAGFDVYFWSDQELKVVDDKAYFGDILISQIKRAMEVGKFSSDLLTRLASTNLKYLNTFDLRALGYKGFLPLLNSAYLPKTQILTQNNIVDFLNCKEKRVLKPSNLFEGRWVLIGVNALQSQREQALYDALGKGFVVQEFIQMQKITTNFYVDGKIHEQNVYFDLCPHYFVKKGKIVGQGHVLMRFSEQQILNVAQGGGIGYLK